MLIELQEQEALVLNIIEDYLNKNREFKIDEIIPYIQSRIRRSSLNLNYKGIETILKSLIEKNYVLEGSKLIRSKILDNEKRKKIYEFILKYPGIYFNHIVRKLQISNHVVVWHLNILLKFKFILKEIVGKHEIYFDANKDFKDIELFYLTSKEKSQKIINYLKQNNIGIPKTQLSEELNMHINTTSKYLKELEQFNVITKQRASNKVLYFLNER
ncbi:MAG: winged helix-turn-helix transcriptional regulator [Promethearchaeota archaeon]